ncbi:type II toxin-antitoxin system Phd/YefM family antitoxin [Tsukamurella sp. M9C]|uniref:type II toxin-antitoxin system Phd/YefM family antitoxin n=1 Tax=unclassified Tsukamurella TaxID=2633480 RepID=UPI001CCAD26D|nr:type II toxin-antitoxin system Phd/YefM family antitoxin [Tsukamurella sp. M9C]MCA0156814.1 type II toxin-antitoxin system Phd/YefM family antitoxin [Tsukamurella sp. M9C]
MREWQVQEAKQRLSELLRAVGEGEPQVITRHGDPIAVVVDIEDFRANHGRDRKPSFSEFLLSAPAVDDFEIPERTVDPDRTEGLFD